MKGREMPELSLRKMVRTPTPDPNAAFKAQQSRERDAILAVIKSKPAPQASPSTIEEAKAEVARLKAGLPPQG